eukprot:scaffold31709_cov41-Cyclotella_meneghiniana.AAC.22
MAIAAASVPSCYSDTKVGRDTPAPDLIYRSIRRGLKCRHRCFGTLLVLRGDSGNGHASNRSTL